MILRVTETARYREIDLPTDQAVVLGRQGESEMKIMPLGPAAEISKDGDRRLIVAFNSQPGMSREHIRLKALPDGRVEVQNLSNKFDALVEGGALLARKETQVFETSARLVLPTCTVEFEPDAGDSGLKRLDESVGMDALAAPQAEPFTSDGGVRPDRLVEYLRDVVGVLQRAVAADDFAARAAEAMVRMVGLHAGQVYRYRDGKWDDTPLAEYCSDGKPGHPSTTVLAALLAGKQTVWQPPSPMTNSSLHGREVVAAPLLDPAGQVIGALFGEKRLGKAAGGLRDRTTAVLVDLLASGVAAGLARQEQTARALTAHAQLSQFPEEIRDRLLAQPELFQKGREAVVSVLFADIRGFSTVSGLLGAAGTIEWVNDIMNALSECVLVEGGVLVDYIGDELIAMWGALDDQPDHPARAVRAAFAMLDTLRGLTDRWRPKTGMPVQIGIGVNTGEAVVGNTGSKAKFKYGPLGPTVNLASRVQGLTKYLKVPFLVTRDTYLAVRPEYNARRVVCTRVVNIKEPVDLYQLEAARTAVERDFLTGSEAALEHFESKRFAEAARRAGQLLADEPGDGPLRLTLARASAMLMADGGGFDPVWEPPGK